MIGKQHHPQPLVGHRWSTSIALLSLLMGVGAASPAHANRVNDLELSMSPDDVVVQLHSESPLGEPRVRVRTGLVRAWFPDVEEDTRLEVQGDGIAIKRVRVRPGASGTALLRIELPRKVRLAQENLRIEVHEGGALLRIPRAALPPAPKPAAAAPRDLVPVKVASKHPGVGQRRAERAARASQKLARVRAAREPRAAGAPPKPGAQQVEGQAEASAERTPQPALAIPARKPESDGSPGAVGTGVVAAAADAGAGRHVGVLLGITALLGLVYAGVRLWAGKRSPALAGSNIEVMGSKRLGPKHQLVMVRALGEDHLLCINGERVERIASTPVPGTQAATLNLFPPMKAASAGFMQALDDRTGEPRRPASAPEVPHPEESEPARDAPFGSELLSFMARRADPSWARRQDEGSEPSAERSVPRVEEQSPAVAGLLRLREQRAA